MIWSNCFSRFISTRQCDVHSIGLWFFENLRDKLCKLCVDSAWLNFIDGTHLRFSFFDILFRHSVRDDSILKTVFVPCQRPLLRWSLTDEILIAFFPRSASVVTLSFIKRAVSCSPHAFSCQREVSVEKYFRNFSNLSELCESSLRRRTGATYYAQGG